MADGAKNKFEVLLGKSLGTAVGRATRSAVRKVLWRSPRLSTLIQKLLREHQADVVHSDIVIEGFPRSGNPFAEIMFRLTQRADIRISSHSHHPSTVWQAIEVKKPTILLLRKPEDALMSWASSWNKTSADGLLNIIDVYVRYHEAILPLMSQLVVVEFDDFIKDYRVLVRRAQDRFQISLNCEFDHAVEAKEAFRLIGERIVAEDGYLNMQRVNYPSDKRNARRASLRESLKEPEIERALLKAQRIFSIVAGFSRDADPRLGENRSLMASLLLDDDRGLGHLHGYHSSVGTGCKLLGLGHLVVCPDSAAGVYSDVRSLPVIRTWSNLVQLSAVPAFLEVARLVLSIRQALAVIRHNYPDYSLTLLLDGLTVRKLLATLLAVGTSNNAIKLVIILRYSYARQKAERKTLIAMLKLFRVSQLFGRGPAYLVTDSVQIQQSLEITQQVRPVVIPIPCSWSLRERNYTTSGLMNKIKTIWPGIPSVVKGANVVARLMPQRVPVGIEVEIDTKAVLENVPREGFPRVAQIEAELSDKQYEDLMGEMDAVLLPYDSLAYRERTSGILIEAFFAGALPFVTDETWMSIEVGRLGLPELIVDWNMPGIWEYIANVSKSNELRGRFECARQSVAGYHNVTSFSRAILTTIGGRVA